MAITNHQRVGKALGLPEASLGAKVTHGGRVRRLDDEADGQEFVGSKVGKPPIERGMGILDSGVVERQGPAMRWIQIGPNRVRIRGSAT